MLDEDNLRRLAEMGIDVYVPRGVVKTSDSAAEAADRRATSAPVAVVLLADAKTGGSRALVEHVVRALRFAGIACVHGEAPDEAALASARALILFGDRLVRAAGALVAAQRQSEIDWVVGVELSALAVDSAAKRALWSELKRMTRELAARDSPARP